MINAVLMWPALSYYVILMLSDVFLLEALGGHRLIVGTCDLGTPAQAREPGPDRDEMSDPLMLALIVAGFAAATVNAQFCDGLVRRPMGKAETEN